MPGPVFLDGEAVSLRTIEEEDLEFLQEAINHPMVWRGIGRPDPVNAEQEREFFEEVVSGDGEIALLVTRDPDTPLGTVGLTVKKEARRAELGYWIAPQHQGEGYGTEAAGLLVDFGFRQRGFHRIEARVFEFNDASQGLLESLGFTLEGTHREGHYVDGSYQDTLWYGVLEEEWDDSTYDGI
ncbi:GNAT family N-acetyltransferase [Halobacteriales archaeon SW_7_65_23]|nr:MAG: GNAT family N-acetyltransferase [Halobacteriales archaeon SW_7_65_23]